MHPRRRRLRNLHRLLEEFGRALALFASTEFLLSCQTVPPCRDLIAKADWLVAEQVCRSSFESHQRVEDGVELALALLYRGRSEDAVALEVRLLQLQPNALVKPRLDWVMGAAFSRLGQPASARPRLQRVLDPNTSPEASTPLRARAAAELAGVEWREGQLSAAHEYHRQATELAAKAGDHSMAAANRLALIDILRLEGDLSNAERELSLLAKSTRTDGDRAFVLLKLGLAYNDLGSAALARGPLTQALELQRARPSPDKTTLGAILLNLSWVERHSGNFAKALEDVDAAEKLGADPMDVHLNRGLALRDAGRLEEAAAELTEAQAEGPRGDWIWWLAFNRGEVAVRLGDSASAEQHFRAAISAVERQRAAASATAPSVSARQRQVYTDLIGVLAPQKRWTDIVELIQRLDDGGMSQLLASPIGSVGAGGFGSARDETALPKPQLPAASILTAWQARRLILLVPGGSRMWRLEMRSGSVVGEDVGAIQDLEGAAMRLEHDPGLQGEARSLGEALRLDQPSGGQSPSSPSVDVLFVGQIGRAPISVLRDQQGLLRDRFALTRVLRLTPIASASSATKPAIILGDPRANLPQARAEAEHVAELLAVAPRIGPEASSAALLEARGATVLHIAAHTTVVEGRPALQLADRAVTLDEIRALTPSPRLVVLASCGSASTRDQDAWGSLASAFLDAGSAAILATTRSIPDDDGRLVTEEFYRQKGLVDPARALAAAQHALEDKIPLDRLAAFVVLRSPPAASSSP